MEVLGQNYTQTGGWDIFALGENRAGSRQFKDMQGG